VLQITLIWSEKNFPLFGLKNILSDVIRRTDGKSTANIGILVDIYSNNFIGDVKWMD
jgi:hypothetical protein